MCARACWGETIRWFALILKATDEKIQENNNKISGWSQWDCQILNRCIKKKVFVSHPVRLVVYITSMFIISPKILHFSDHLQMSLTLILTVALYLHFQEMIKNLPFPSRSLISRCLHSRLFSMHRWLFERSQNKYQCPLFLQQRHREYSQA